MSPTTNIKRIVTDHLDTFRHYAERRWLMRDIAVVFGLPLLCLVAAVWWGVRLNEALVNAGLTAFSVFAGLLLSVLVLLYSVVQTERNAAGQAPVRTAEQVRMEKVRAVFLKQVHANVSFSILECVAVIVLCLGLLSCGKDGWKNGLAVALSGALIGLTVNFLLTLLMVLKRIHVLMGREFDHSNANGEHAWRFLR